MKTITPVRSLAFLAVGLALLGSPVLAHAASSAATEAVASGDNTLTITRRATSAFQRDTDQLKELVQEDAAKYCAAQNKQLKVVKLTSAKPFFSTGYASATIVFKALAPGEVDVAPAAPGAPVVQYVERPITTDEMYAELMKLDELRKKNILTDEEFQAEKKKVLARSK